MNKNKAWLEAFRLRTLPLAASTILIGALPAIHHDLFNLPIFMLVLLTTSALQILSNLANDYGDFKKGTDNKERLGPTRSVQSGAITPAEMRRMIFTFIAISLGAGITLLWVALGREQLLSGLVMLLLGGMAIWAAIKYTIGKNAFGYIGMGDLFVLVFFGFVGVGGTYFLFGGVLNQSIALLSLCPGLLAVGVLNVNNMRDVINDESCHKQTMVVRIGIRYAKMYHYTLLMLALLAAAAYLWLNNLPWMHFVAFAVLPLFLYHALEVKKKVNASLDPQLKVLSLSSFVFSLCLVILAFSF